MDPIVTLERALAYVHVAADAPEATDVSGMLDAISAEVRSLTNRALEGGDGADYDEIIRIDRQQEFYLTQVPVDPDQPITITPVLFDGTELDTLDTTQWRLEDAATGRIRVLATMRGWAGGDAIQSPPHRLARYDSGPEYVHATWSTTGSVSPALTFGILEWLKTRWDARTTPPHLAGYVTGKDAETYFAGLIGSVPPSVARAIIGSWHPSNGGVI